MKDLTPSSFGLLIAFFLPGLAALFSLGFWSEQIAGWFSAFLKPGAKFDLLGLVALASLTLGLEITLVRWLLFEKLLCCGLRLTPEDFEGLAADEHTLPAFRAAIEENYRYHQFWGGIAIVMPIGFVGWSRAAWGELSWISAIVTTLIVVMLESLTVVAAVTAFGNYVDRGKSILRRSKKMPNGMATFFILVMDKYRNDPNYWIYSASASSEATLKGMFCYTDPPHSLPKGSFVEVSSTRTSLPPCAGGSSEGGTIYGIRHV